MSALAPTRPATITNGPVARALRVAWLLNHTTLREFEVPLIRSFGLEVYTAKLLPNGNEFLSATTDYEDDRNSSIDPVDLQILNSHNFYEDEFTAPVAAALNRNFDTIMCANFGMLVKELVHRYRGRILVRVFGREHPHNYTEYFNLFGEEALWTRIQAIEDRFWFAPCYPSIVPIEGDILKRRSIVLPLGLPESKLALRDTWTGTDPRILFVCPRIASHPHYYGRIYDEFKREVGDLPYVLGGHQPVPLTDDPHVLGFISDEDYHALFKKMRVMFYHSREPRHLHYHPLEAIVSGMPLIFMRGGLLEEFGGTDQPGACADYREARQKLKLVLDGDQTFIAQVRAAQPKILEPFTLDFNAREWRRLFHDQVMQTPLATDDTIEITEGRRPTRIALILPEPYRGGTMRCIKQFAKMFKVGAKEAGDNVEVVLAVRRGHYDTQRDFQDVRQHDIKVREFDWRIVGHVEGQAMIDKDGCWSKKRLHRHAYQMPVDGTNNLLDCDFWFFESDRFSYPPLPLRPYGIVVTDFLQRYVPEAFGEPFWAVQAEGFIPAVRDAQFVIATTPPAAGDLNSYCGVRQDCIRFLHTFLESELETLPTVPWHEPYFVWMTNTGYHKNHERILAALQQYYEQFGGTLKALVVGTESQVFDSHNKDPKWCQHPYVLKIKGLIERSPTVRKHLIFAGELPDLQYNSAVRHAKFLFSGNLQDNGCLSTIDAACLGVPSLCAGYPAQEYFNEKFQLNNAFFPPRDVEAMAAALHHMELHAAEISLPSKEFLHRFHWRYCARQVYDMILPYVKR